MKQPILFALVVVGFCLTAAAQVEVQDALPSSLVTPEILAAKIAEVEAAVDLQDESKTRLIELYRRALSNLEEANANAVQASSFEEAARTAPVQTQRIREELEAAQDTDPLVTLDVDESTPREQIEERLKKGEADLAAVDARRADFEGRLTRQQNQLEAISQRLTDAKQQQEEVTAALEVPAEPDDSPGLAQAKRWVLDTRYTALSAEIKMLNQELLSHPMRVDLLEARRDREAAGVEGLRAQVMLLGELVNSKRRLEAEEAKVEAEEVRRETAGLHPLLVRLSEQNAELTDELNAMAARLDVLDREQAEAQELTKRIVADFKDVEATVEAGGLSPGVGRLLLEQRESFPNVLPYRRKAQSPQRADCRRGCAAAEPPGRSAADRRLRPSRCGARSRDHW